MTLAQHAAVQAAAAEGHPLPEALAWVGVPASAWPKGSAALRQTLSKDAAALKAHQLELAKAEDRLHRAVPPIDGDPVAWVTFMACVAAAPDVVALLAEIDLGPNDVSRVNRAWTRRMAGDGALRRRIADLQGEIPDPPVMPALHPAPRPPLVPAAPAAAGTPPAAAAVSTPEVALAEAAPAPPSSAVVPTYLIETPPAPGQVVPLPAPRVGTADLTEAWESGQALPFAEGPPSLPPSTRAVALEGGSSATVDVSEAWDGGTTLPFVDPATAAAAPAKAPAAELPSTGTVDVSELWASGQALPFAGTQAPVEAAAGGASTATVDVSELWASGQVLPFAGSTGSAGAEAPDDADVEADSTATVDLGDIWARGQAASERAPASGAAIELSPEQYASLCVELAVDPARTEETLRRYRLDAGARARLDALFQRRFAENPEARAAHEQASAAYRAWLQGQRAVTATAPTPEAASLRDLSLTQYASLTVEIAADPARVDETRSRYGLTAFDHGRVEAAWRARLADGQARAAFEQACAAYRAWLAQRAR